MSLLPEKPLTFSPQLAATLGLEEAILLQALIEISYHQHAKHLSGGWLDLDITYLANLLPFWSEADIQRLIHHLQQQGVIGLDKFHQQTGKSLRVSLDQSLAGSPAQNHAVEQPDNLRMIRQWQPETDVITQLHQYGIPADFIQQQLPEFITYWRERDEPHYSWGSKFLKHILRLWRQQQVEDAKEEKEIAMHSQWLPSADAMEILHLQAGINPNFIEDAIPEFILYWKERGNRSSTWNTRFVQHVRRQWIKFNATLEHCSDPHVIPGDWRPTEDLYEVLKLANIPRTFAEQEIPGFVLYWRETGRAENSWNTKFLQFIKRRWTNNLTTTTQANNDHRTHQPVTRPVSTRDRSIIDDLTDRSWAN